MTDASALLSEASRELASFPRVLDLLVGDLDEGTCRSRPAPDEWAPVEIICHLRDEETEDFAARVSVILDGGVRFARNDPERSVIERRYREADPRAALAAFHARRAASIELLATVAPDRLLASADRPDGGRLSGLDLLAAWVTHDRLHLLQLTGTLARLWANRWAPLETDYAGPIPYASS
jgi:DinB family protein